MTKTVYQVISANSETDIKGISASSDSETDVKDEEFYSCAEEEVCEENLEYLTSHVPPHHSLINKIDELLDQSLHTRENC